MARRVTIKGGHGGRIEILNLEGRQICDLSAFARNDIAEFPAPARTRAQLIEISRGPAPTDTGISSLDDQGSPGVAL